MMGEFEAHDMPSQVSHQEHTASHAASDKVSDKASEPTRLDPSDSPPTWHLVAVKSRVDSFSQDQLLEELVALRRVGHQRIALDLRVNRFLSLPVIKHCVAMSRELSEAGGAFALIACSEKTKRHFEIYGSLNHISLVRSAADLVLVRIR